MKKTISLLIVGAILFAACNNHPETSANEEPHPSSEGVHATTNEANITSVRAAYTKLDNKVAAFVNSIITDYLGIKNALVNSDENTASQYASNMNKTLKAFDQSLLTVDQKKAFDKVESNLRNTSEIISKPGLDEQRKQFREMSNSIYEFAKEFETGKILYHEYCPMYEGGSLWLSDNKEIKNPFYGDKMMECGTVKEIIQ